MLVFPDGNQKISINSYMELLNLSLANNSSLRYINRDPTFALCHFLTANNFIEAHSRLLNSSIIFVFLDLNSFQFFRQYGGVFFFFYCLLSEMNQLHQVSPSFYHYDIAF